MENADIGQPMDPNASVTATGNKQKKRKASPAVIPSDQEKCP